MMIPLLSIILTSCSQRKPCPKVIYPTLEAVSKVPRIEVVVKDGMMDRNSTKKAFYTLKALRVSEYYYWGLISEYREEFLK